MWTGRISAGSGRATLAAVLGALLALVLGLCAAAPATAATRHGLPAPAAVETVQIGPVVAAGGFSLYVTGQDCGSANPDVTLSFLTGGAKDQLSHTYTATNANCSVSPGTHSARLSVKVPGFVNIAVQVAAVSPPLARPAVPVGCGPPAGPERAAVATGQINVAIHPDVLGRVGVTHAAAEIFAPTHQTCPGVQSTDGRELTADIGPYIIDGDVPSHGPAQLDILDGLGDNPAPGLVGVLGLHMSGPPALSVDGATAAARIGASSSLSAGSLGFTPLAPCADSSAQNGTLSGTLTINDPVLGPQRIVGSAAASAYTGEGTAAPGTCNGPGALPLAPSLVNTCTGGDAGCSIRAQNAVITFFDESSPGTQTVTAESVNFGDGSAPVTLSPGGALEHAYTAAGTYGVTLSVTDAAGDVASDTSNVVIEP